MRRPNRMPTGTIEAYVQGDYTDDRRVNMSEERLHEKNDLTKDFNNDN